MSLLSEQINQHLEKNFTAFHSPAHNGLFNPRDLTELDGLDDLQFPQGVLLESQELTAQLFGAAQSFYLINGASQGTQAACLALGHKPKPVLLARNVHKSVIAGVILAGLDIEWFDPEWDKNLGIYRHCKPAVIASGSEAIPNALNQNYSAIILTNPTYEGFYSELPQLDIPVIIDEAHGAHYHFSDRLPKPALECGADIVVQSWHKTLGSLTQTGVIHISKSSKIPAKHIEDSLRLLQSTSPSYLLLESLCNITELYAEQGKEIINNCLGLANAIDPSYRYPNDDPTRVIIPGPGELIEESLAEAKILIEASYPNFCLAFINPSNTSEEIQTLDSTVIARKAKPNEAIPLPLTYNPQPQFGKQIINPREVFFSTSKEVPIKDAINKIAQELYAPCPPGIPLLVPGQEISPDIALYLENLDKSSIDIIL